jgi:catechol-2,3-dioxygenase
MATMLSFGLAAKLFIDHLVLVVSDIGRTREFYSKILGEPAYQNERSLVKIWLNDPDKIRIEFFIYA